MIIKTLSRSGLDGIRPLIKYISKIHKITPSNEIDLKFDQRQIEKHFYTAGVQFTKEDLTYLLREKSDAKLMAAFKKHGNGDIKAFIEKHILNTQYHSKNEMQRFIYMHNVTGNNIDEMIKQFEMNEQGRIHTRSNQSSIVHTILSWNAMDTAKLNDEMLLKMTQEYVRLRGENNIYAFTKHVDKNHIHIHCAMSATALNGLSSRVSKTAFAQIKKDMDLFQRQHMPALVHSLPHHGKIKEIGVAAKTPHKTDERAIVKTSVLGCIETHMKNAKSTGHFVELLKESNYSVYYRSGRLTGIQSANGLKFKFSRLGVDLGKLTQLDAHKATALQEIKAIRKGQIKGMERNMGIDKIKAEQDSEILYHGTAKGNFFNMFDLTVSNRGVGSNAFHQGNLVYLTDREDAARYFSKQATENYRLWKSRLENSLENIVSEVGEVYKVQLDKNANIKLLNHRPDFNEITKLKQEGYDAVKFKEIAFESVEGSKDVFEILGKGVPNTIVVFASEKLVILDNGKSKDLERKESLLKTLHFETAMSEKKEQEKLQEVLNRNREFEEKLGISDSSISGQNENIELQELKSIRESRGNVVGRDNRRLGAGRDADREKIMMDDRNVSAPDSGQDFNGANDSHFEDKDGEKNADINDNSEQDTCGENEIDNEI